MSRVRCDMSCSELCHDQSTFPPPVTTSQCYNQNNSLGEILLYSVRRTIVKGTVTVRISYHKNHELKLLPLTTFHAETPASTWLSD